MDWSIYFLDCLCNIKIDSGLLASTFMNIFLSIILLKIGRYPKYLFSGQSYSPIYALGLARTLVHLRCVYNLKEQNILTPYLEKYTDAHMRTKIDPVLRLNCLCDH